MIMLLNILIIIFMIFDIRLNRKLTTPLVVLIGPQLVLLSIAKLLENRLNIERYLIIYFFIACMFFIFSLIFKLLFSNLKTKNQIIKKVNIKRMSYLISIISIVSFIILLLTYGVAHLKGKSVIILGHLENILLVFIPLFSEIYKDRKIKIIAYFIFFYLLIIGGKYQVFMYILPLILYRIDSSKIKLRKIIILLIGIGISIYVIFYSVYYVKFLSSNIHISFLQMNNFIFNHIRHYVLSPFYIGEYFLKNPNSTNNNIALTPFFNIFNFITGKKSYINPILKFQTYFGITSNVGGLIPELVYTLGYVGMYSYMIVLGIISYFLDNLTNKNKLWMYSNLILKSSLVLCFFNNVFSVFGYIERIVGSILFIIFLKIMRGVENEGNNISRRKWNKTLSNNKSNIKTDKSNL